ncbi:hypothetical protein [Aquimarina sp. RZ0]|uniref:hypothetical protein n=1 Tax=Aquimarina sp. RZ0 TaxID=2607730 RepID=UPI0011F20395|nr:hypothetical protein [Aquimarina sp. RZ0]KAA1246633.1 hypothetical protein F0000_07045 [Aquimarina sp. RZ0]
MEFLDIHKNKKSYSNQNNPNLTFENIQMASTSRGIGLSISISYLKKNNFKVDIKGKMLRVGMMVSKITAYNKSLLKKYCKYIFIEGHIALPYRKQLPIDTIKYRIESLLIQRIEKSREYNREIKKKRSKIYHYIQNSKEVLQLIS